jgi:hypothetical protein
MFNDYSSLPALSGAVSENMVAFAVNGQVSVVLVILVVM